MYTRNLEPLLRDALADTPVVLIHGARQVGKTTLAEAVSAQGEHRGRQTLSLDRTAVLAAATADPDGFIEGLAGPVFIDEVQRAPGLFPAIKHAVDQDRTPGRFLLSGSANVLALPKLSESLAGRMEICTLWPLTQAEIEGRNTTLIDALFAPGKLSAGLGADEPDVWARILRGGFPEAAERVKPQRRRAWFEAYLNTILQRDIRDLASIDRLTELSRLLQLVAARAGGLLSYTDLATGLAMSQSTVKRYLALLEAVFMVKILPAWTANLSGRVIKSPKVHLLDSGLAAALIGVDEVRLREDGTLRGQLLESFAAMELIKMASVSTTKPTAHHFRTTAGREVDVVLEAADGRIVGIEMKAATSIDSRELRGLEALQEAAGNRFYRGIMLYTGTEIVPFGNNLWAMPIAALWR